MHDASYFNAHSSPKTVQRRGRFLTALRYDAMRISLVACIDRPQQMQRH